MKEEYYFVFLLKNNIMKYLFVLFFIVLFSLSSCGIYEETCPGVALHNQK